MNLQKQMTLKEKQEKKQQIKKLYEIASSKKPQAEISQQVEEYLLFFSDALHISQNFDAKKISNDTLLKHEIKVIDQNDDYLGKIVDNKVNYVDFVQSKMYGLECSYEVIIGNFYLTIKVLNLPYSVQGERGRNIEQQKLGQGSFGIVKKAEADGLRFAVKRILFQKSKSKMQIPGLLDPNDYCNHKKIKRAIEQYSIYKICSMLEIGPKVMFNEAYDLICYNNGIEFYMQLCENPIEHIREGYDLNLKLCISLLHRVKFVHNDIKPSNILYSPSLNKLVLTDFGLTHPISQSLDEKTETGRKGSAGYLSVQMESIQEKKRGLVNMYYNDMYALKKTLYELKSMALYKSSSSSSMYSSSSASQSFMSSSSLRNQLSYIERSQNQSSQCYEEQSKDDTYQMKSTTSQASQSTNQPNNDSLRIFAEGKSKFNFYMMKSIHDLLHSGLKKEKYFECLNKPQRTKQMRIKSVLKVCEKQSNIINTIQQMVDCLLEPYEEEQYRLLSKVRNIHRVFGRYSEQFINVLEQIKNVKVSFINQQLLGQIILQLSQDKQEQQDQYNKTDEIYLSYLRNTEFIENLGKQIKQITILMNLNLKSKEKAEEIKQKMLKSITRLVGTNQIQIELYPIIYKYLKSFDGNSKGKWQELPQFCQLESDIESTDQFREKIKLLLQLYKVCSKVEFEQKNVIGLFFYIFELNRYYKISRQIIAPTVLEKKKQIQQQFLSKVNLSNLNSIENKAVKKALFQLILIQLRSRYALFGAQNVINSIKPMINFIDEDIHFPKLAILIYKIIFQNYLEIKMYEEAENCIKKIKKLHQNFYYAKDNHRSANNEYQLRGILAKQLGRYDQAIQYYKKQIELLEQNLMQKASVNSLFKAYLALLNCCCIRQKMSEADFYVEKMMELSMPLKLRDSYEGLKEEQSRTGFFIRFLIKNNKLNNVWKLICRIVEIRIKHFINMQKLTANGFKLFRRQGFITKQFYQECAEAKIQTMVKFKIILIRCLQNYLPLYLWQYRQLCLVISDYYINVMNQQHKALPFIWLYFQKLPLLNSCTNQKDQLFYTRVNWFASMMMQSNLYRKTLYFLEQYVYKIPDQAKIIKQTIFKKLCTVSKVMKDKRSQFYDLIRNYEFKPYLTVLNFQLFSIELDSISKDQIPIGLKKVYQKKLKVLKPIDENDFEQNQLWQPQKTDGLHSVEDFYELICKKRREKFKQLVFVKK